MATKNKKHPSIDIPSSPQDGRVIKKYPNRRLYDTLTSTYIALSDIKQLVMNGVAFKVIDAKSEEDLTRSLLLQIILEEEAAGLPMFSESLLYNLIRSYGHAQQSVMGQYFEQIGQQMNTQMQQFHNMFGLKSA